MPTLVKAINSSKLVIQLGNGASPEVFGASCMINTSRSLRFTASVTETVIPYCPPDEDLAAWVDRETDVFSGEISGAGTFDQASIVTWHTWFFGGLSKNLRVLMNGEDGTGHGYYAGAAVLTDFELGGAGRREKVTFTSTIQTDGVWTYTALT